TDVTVYTEGTSPNQVEIIQWRNSRQLGSMGSAFDMQIWLYEGPAARFEIHYGPQSNIAMDFSYSGSVGFEDVTGSNGFVFMSCTPGCTGADFATLPDTVFQALQDAGTDLAAASVSLTSTADPLRVYQGIPFDVASQINSYHADPIGPFTYSL